MSSFVLFVSFVVNGVLAQDHDHGVPEKLGTVHFPTSCAAAVTPDFDRAVALLHSFSFGPAIQGFQGVLTKDASCAMAYWGIALSQWGNPFGGLKAGGMLTTGLASAEKGLTSGTPTAREHAYLAAVAELYRNAGAADQRARTLAYEHAMEALHQAYPDDKEATAFYALAAAQTALPTDKTYAQLLKAGALLEPLFKEQPDHPGLAHYIIHSYDVPALAPRALEAARRYASIAPSAPHALHMPAHTFTRLGLWQESVDTNIKSAAAANRDGMASEALHATDYEVYAYLQMAMDRDARRLVDALPGAAPATGAAVAGAASPAAGSFAALAIPARYAMERGAWSEAAVLVVRPSNIPYAEALTQFARAIGGARSGKLDVARAAHDRLGALADREKELKDAYWESLVRIQQQAASAWIAFAEGRKPEAIDLLTKAADAEDATEKAAVSPGPLAPARELLGDMLLAVDRPADALKAFEAVMKKEPNRFRATAGAAQAAVKAGDRAKAKTYYTKLLEIAKTGDSPGRPELVEARAFLAKS